MKAKIDLEKLISSMLRYAEDNCEETMLDYLHSALQDQDLEYKDGEIVEIEQEDIRKRYERIGKSDWFKKTHEGMSITIPDDLIGTDMDGGVVGEKGEEGEPPTDKNFRERYENIAQSDWFKKTHKDISIGEEQPTEEEMVGMGELGKVWKEQAIISRLNRIIELLERPIIMPFSQPIQPLQPIYYDTNKIYCDTASTEGGEK